MGQLLGHAPKLPRLSQTQPKSLSIIIRQVMCVPPWCFASPSCTQGSHIQISSFSQPITSFLVLFVCPSPNMAKERMHSVGVVRDLTSSPTPSCCHPRKHPLISMASLPIFISRHQSTIVASSTIIIKPKVPLGHIMNLQSVASF
jgi:hypothetical protein